MSSDSSPLPTRRDRANDHFGHVETAGVETIPEADRHSSPANVFFVFVGGNLAFSVIVFGWLPVTFGLSWLATVTASATGLLTGLILIAPMTLLGPRTGTNNPVSSGAHFGVRGRYVGSTLTLLFAIAYAAIAVWTSGDALIAGLHRLIGTPDGDVALAIGYALIAIEIVAVALYGHATVVAMQKFVIPVIGALLLLGLPAYADAFVVSAGHGDYLLGSFWPTWLLAVTIAIGGPLSYAPSVGDYTRRISRRRHGDGAIALATCSGIFVGLFATSAFGAYTAVGFGAGSTDYVRDLVAHAPLWYVAPIIAIALAGGLGQGVINIYASGLDLEAIIPRLRRTQTTLITSLIAITVMYVGVFVVDAVDAITAMTIVLNALAGPWVAINAVGFILARRGHYDPDDLQVFARGRRGGRYWFTRGWNPRAMIPFTVAAVLGVLLVNTSLYVGPLANIADGVDISFAVAALVGGLGYALALKCWPESSP